MYTVATGISDIVAEMATKSTIDRNDAWSAFDAAPAWDIVAPSVDAPQAAANLLALLEKSRG